MRPGTIGRWLTAGTVSTLALLAWAAPAAAEVSGNCDALIKGVSAHDRSSTDPGQAIKVKQDETVAYSVASAAGVTNRRFIMEYAGFSIVVDKGTGKGNDSFSSGGAAVKDYAWMGAGLYKVRGEATLKGGATCSGAVLIDVEGNPLTTVAGVAGVIAVVTGLIGVIAASGTKSGEIIDELVGFVTGPNGPAAETAAAGTGLLAPTGGRRNRGGDPASGSGTEGTDGTGDPASPGANTGAEPVEEPPTRKGRHRAGGGDLPGTAAGGTAAGGTAVGGAAAGGAAAGGTAAGGTEPIAPVTPVTPASGKSGPNDAAPAPVAAGGGTDGATPGEEQKPPPLPGMGFVTGTGEKADALIKAHETLTNAIGELPISEEQQKKLTETLGLEKIKEKLDQVKEVTDTVTHFEAVGTETVDNLNRWGVPPRMVEAILWFRWTTEASGRATQKFTDALVTPVLEPVTKAVGEAGIKADATEIAHALLPVQEFAEEASKAAMNSVKNVLGGQQAIDQRAQGGENEEEWNIVRPRR
jgi:hypothetical protein